MSVTAENLRFTTVVPMNTIAFDSVPVSSAPSSSSQPSSAEHIYSPVVAQILSNYETYLPGYSVYRKGGTKDWLLLCTLSGRGCFGEEGNRVVLEESDLALVRPGTPHRYSLEGNQGHWKQLWFHFHPRPHWHDWLGWPEALPGVARLSLDEPVIRQKVLENLWQAHHLARGGLARQADFAMNALEAALLWCDTQNPQTFQGRLDSRVMKAMDFLCRNLSDPASPAVLSQVSGLSPSWLSHLFRTQTGLPPAQFLDQQRLTHAEMQLQNTSRPVSEIAADVGMDPAYFSHWFKRHAAVNPREYRHKHQQ